MLGELILIEGQQDRHGASEALFDARASLEEYENDPARRHSEADVESEEETRDHRPEDQSESTPRANVPINKKLHINTQFEASEPSPLVPATSRLSPDENEVSLVLHHSDDEDDDPEDVSSPSLRTTSPLATMRNRPTNGKARDTADKAGVILGIHNVFLVLPQFIVTIMASIIFYLMDPPVVPVAAVEADMGPGSVDTITRREGAVEGGNPDAVGLIFRIGGLSALVGAIVCMRLGRAWRRGEGI